MTRCVARALRGVSRDLAWCFLIWLTVSCGGDSTGPEEPGDVRVLDVSGSWLSPVTAENGVPISRYDIVQTGNVLSGEAYWRSEGALERIGSFSGTIDADGNAQWLVVLDDNGWDGTESVEARFVGAEAGSGTQGGGAPPASVSGTWVWKAPDGSVRESGTFSLNRPELVIPAPGTGALGEAGLWRGVLLYTSPGLCNTTGFRMAISLSSTPDQVVGTASAKPFPRGAPAPKGLDGWFGHMEISLQGHLFVPRPSDPRSGLGVVTGGAMVNSSWDGELHNGPGAEPEATQWIGEFRHAPPCHDRFGAHTSGVFLFQSERVVEP